MERWRTFNYQYAEHIDYEQTTDRLYGFDGSLIGEWVGKPRESSSGIVYAYSAMSDDDNGRIKRDNPLWFTQDTQSPSEISGSVKSRRSVMGLSADERIETFRVKKAIYGTGLGNEIDSDDITFITKAVADTNPSSSQFNGLAFAAEMRDLPRLVQSAGHTLSKFGANEYLKFQYGWRPFVQDVKKLTAITGKIRRRMMHLERLRVQGSVRSNYDPKGPDGQKTYRAEYIDPYGHYPTRGGDIRIHCGAYVSVKRWAQIVWKPDRPPRGWWTPGDDNRYAQAVNAVYGLNLDGPQLWQAMPWSWMVDWFHNTSDYIKSQNNSVGATVKDTVLMRDLTETIVTEPRFVRSPLFVESNLHLVGGISRRRERSRILGLEPAVVSNGGVGDILSSNFKTSILGALGVQRLKGL